MSAKKTIQLPGIDLAGQMGVCMIKSMTGYGCCEITDEERKIAVEIKAVNHRYLDISIKMPKKLNLFESAIRNLLKQYIKRGKIDVAINYEDYTERRKSIKYNEGLAGEYAKYIKQMAGQFQLEEGLSAISLSRYPEVLTMEEQGIDEQQLWNILEQALTKAAGQFVDSRVTEGANLKKDLLEKLDGMISYIEKIEERAPGIISDYREKLKAKAEELLGDTKIEEGRLIMEVTIFADKMCTDEELVRLKSHISSTKETLETGDSIGRKLDFIAQEMNREANTILSKANDITVAEYAINLKADIEKVREQIQNIE